MASEVDVEDLIREHIRGRHAAANPPADFHHRLMARLDTAEPRRPGIVPQLAMALAIVLGVAGLLASISYIKSHWSTPRGPSKSRSAVPYSIPSPPAVAASCSSVPRQWASSPPNPAKMLSPTTGWAYGPMRTTDGGAHWLDVSPPSIPNRTPKNDMFFLDATHAWVAETASSATRCVDQVVTFRTADGGETWQQAAPITVRYADPTDVIWTGVVNHTSWFDFIDAQYGWLLLGTGSVSLPGNPETAWSGAPWSLGDLYRTTDGGLHWTLAAANPGSAAGCTPGAPGPTLHQAAMSFASRTTGWMVGSCGLLVTHDGGVTWGKAAMPLEPTEAPIFFDQMHGLIFGAGLLVTSDGGAHWNLRKLPAAAAIDFINSNEGWALTTGGTSVQCSLNNLASCTGNFRLFHTGDGGRTWVLGNDTSLAMQGQKWWPPSYLHFVDSKNGFADPGESGLFRTTDAGRTWTRVEGTIQGP
jgi:photosystem II stability/assembly factor-like uncharacterized protein